MFCPFCGKQIDTVAEPCPACGGDLARVDLDEETRPFLPGRDELPSPRPLEEVITFSELEVDGDPLKKSDTGAVPLDVGPFAPGGAVRGPVRTGSAASREQVARYPAMLALSLLCCGTWLALATIVIAWLFRGELARKLVSWTPMPVEALVAVPVLLTLILLVAASRPCAAEHAIRPLVAFERLLVWFALAALPAGGMVLAPVGAAKLAARRPGWITRSVAAVLLASGLSLQAVTAAVLWIRLT